MARIREILQIIPADGWFAQILGQKTKSDALTMSRKELICWALVVQPDMGPNKQL
jgi:hypothetical protein